MIEGNSRSDGERVAKIVSCERATGKRGMSRYTSTLPSSLNQRDRYHDVLAGIQGPP